MSNVAVSVKEAACCLADRFKKINLAVIARDRTETARQIGHGSARFRLRTPPGEPVFLAG
jgi:hypothetical protein